MSYRGLSEVVANGDSCVPNDMAVVNRHKRHGWQHTGHFRSCCWDMPLQIFFPGSL